MNKLAIAIASVALLSCACSHSTTNGSGSAGGSGGTAGTTGGPGDAGGTGTDAGSADAGSPTDAGSADAGPPDAGARDAGADAGELDGGIQTLEDYANAVAQAACDQLIRCHEFDPALASYCVALYSKEHFQKYEIQVNSGSLIFNAAGEDLCVAEITQEAQSSCAPLGSGPDCPVTLIADAGIGANCTGGVCSDGDCQGSGCDAQCIAAGGLNQRCISNVVCDPGLSCDGDTCLPPSPPGGPCNWTASNTCDVHGYCPINGSTCVALPGPGQPCDDGSSPECDPTVAYCDYDQPYPFPCVPVLDAGASCTSDLQCGTSRYCDASRICRVRSGDGGSCEALDACDSPLRCISGICTPPHGVGQSCEVVGDCQPRLNCDEVSRICLNPTYADAGEPCDNAGVYCNGEWCKDPWINPDGGIGAYGTCIAGIAGDPCRTNTQCYRGTYCNYKADAGVDAGTCEPSFEGAVCSWSYNCAAGQYCPNTGTPRTCRHLGDAGESCESTYFAECQDGLTCKTDAGSTLGTCGLAGAAGDPCIVGGNGQCRNPDSCVGGVCVLQEVVGTECSQYGDCIWGWCNSSAVDAGPYGTCEPYLADGTNCNGDTQCASGICLHSVCSDACF